MAAIILEVAVLQSSNIATLCTYVGTHKGGLYREVTATGSDPIYRGSTVHVNRYFPGGVHTSPMSNTLDSVFPFFCRAPPAT